VHHAPARRISLRDPDEPVASVQPLGVIVSRTPLRISFVGGGTDLPQFYEGHGGGAVVSTSIDKWIHVVVARRFEGDIRVSYSSTEIVPKASDLEHELVREGLRATGMPRGLDVVTLADLPSGTGLGSSSTVMVGVLAALYAFQGVYRSPYDLAEEAAQIEIDRLGKPIGRQDQYAAAVGGFNLIEFLPGDGGVRVQPIICPRETLTRLHRSMLLFYTGRQRSAEAVLSKQKSAITSDAGSTIEALTAMRGLAYELRDRLGRGEPEALGELLDRNWQLKRSLTDAISNPEIDDLYQRAKDAGAVGGKLLGAGSAGFMLIVAPDEQQASVRAALSGLREVPFRFTARGTHIPLFEPALRSSDA
jgi:D-glycero-alpha-D-manno-heptose-7-phosphate kinase